MRELIDKEKSVKTYKEVLFESIPDDYNIKSVFTEDSTFIDLSYLGIMKYLKESFDGIELQGNELGIEFKNSEWFRSEVFQHLSFDYMNSAYSMCKQICAERDSDKISYKIIPCAYLCKHAIELMLKSCLLFKGETQFFSHSLKKLWEQLNEVNIPHYEEITKFILEFEMIDSNDMSLRYGLDREFGLLPVNLFFDIDCLVNNALFLFNILNEYVIDKYRNTTNQMEDLDVTE